MVRLDFSNLRWGVGAFEQLEQLGWQLEKLVPRSVGGVAERDAGVVLAGHLVCGAVFCWFVGLPRFVGGCAVAVSGRVVAQVPKR